MYDNFTKHKINVENISIVPEDVITYETFSNINLNNSLLFACSSNAKNNVNQ